MGFNKYFVPEPTALLDMFRRTGVRNFFNRKIDAMIGSAESMRIIDEAYKLVEQEVHDTEIINIIEKKHGESTEAP